MKWFYYRIWDDNQFIGVWRSKYDYDVFQESLELHNEVMEIFPNITVYDVEMLSPVITVDQLIEDSKKGL